MMLTLGGAFYVCARNDAYTTHTHTYSHAYSHSMNVKAALRYISDAQMYATLFFYFDDGHAAEVKQKRSAVILRLR